MVQGPQRCPGGFFFFAETEALLIGLLEAAVSTVSWKKQPLNPQLLVGKLDENQWFSIQTLAINWMTGGPPFRETTCEALDFRDIGESYFQTSRFTGMIETRRS